MEHICCVIVKSIIFFTISIAEIQALSIIYYFGFRQNCLQLCAKNYRFRGLKQWCWNYRWFGRVKNKLSRNCKLFFSCASLMQGLQYSSTFADKWEKKVYDMVPETKIKIQHKLTTPLTGWWCWWHRPNEWIKNAYFNQEKFGLFRNKNSNKNKNIYFIHSAVFVERVISPMIGRME